MSQQRSTSQGAAAPPVALPALWLRIARGAWLVIAVCFLGLFVASIPVYFTYVRDMCVWTLCTEGPTPPPGVSGLQQLGLSPSGFAALYTTFHTALALIFLAVAGLLCWHPSAERMALFGAVTLLIWGLIGTSQILNPLGVVYPRWQPVLGIVRWLSLACITYFFYLFPDGRFVPSATRWLALAFLALFLPGFVWPGSPLDDATWPVPATSVIQHTYLNSLS